MITTFICMFIDYPILYARIRSNFGLSMACEPHIVGNFFESEPNSFWVSSIFRVFKLLKIYMWELLPKYMLKFKNYYVGSYIRLLYKVSFRVETSIS